MNLEYERAPSASALRLAEKLFAPGVSILTDVDGVLCQANNLDFPLVTSLPLIQQLRQYEHVGVSLGLATARSNHIIDFFRKEHGLRLSGPTILEEGQIVLNGNDKPQYLTHPHHPLFVHHLRNTMKMLPEFRHTWEEVSDSDHASDSPIFCEGNIQWQGASRVSWWFNSRPGKNATIMNEFFTPIIMATAQTFDIDPSLFEMKLSETTYGLAYVRLIGRHPSGYPITKGLAATTYLNGNPRIFFADGPGDVDLAETTKANGGMVIGIRQTFDITPDIAKFFTLADITLNHPSALAMLLEETRQIVEHTDSFRIHP
jgi:hypothetical protein